MKTYTIAPTFNIKQVASYTLFVLSLLFFSSSTAQTTFDTSLQSIVKGKVTTAEGPLQGANVLLKGTTIGTTTDKNGEFTFPQPLDVNDILIFSYLSYETKEIRIVNPSSFIEVNLSDDLIEIMGAPASNQPYKSKQRN